MNRLPAKFHLNDYIFKGARLTDTYSLGRRIHRDREIRLKNKQTKRNITLSENVLKDAFEKTEGYLYSLPLVNSIEELKNRLQVGLMYHPNLRQPVCADSVIWLLDHLQGGNTVDCRPHHVVPEKFEV